MIPATHLLLDSEKVYSIREIDTWFNENWPYYNWISDRWRCKKCPTFKSLPCICIAPDDQWKFLKLYEAIDEILRFHRKEAYFKNEIIEYHNIKYSKINLKIWAAKNHDLGLNIYANFSRKFLAIEKESSSIRVYGSSEIELYIINKLREETGRGGFKTVLDYDVFINKEHFKHTIEFIKIFDDVFWVQEILPESIARIEKI